MAKHIKMRGYVISIFLLIFVAAGPRSSFGYQEEIKNLSTAMAETIAKAGRRRVAVVDFTDLQGNVTELGRFLAEEFSVALAGAGRGFEVVDRVHLKTILAEHKLSAAGLIDPKTAQKLGQIAGVEALITGTITPFGDSVRLSVKILDTATARVVGGYTGNVAKTKAIEELLARGIESQSVGGGGPPSNASLTIARGAAKFQDFPKFRVEVEGFQIGPKGEATVFLNYINKVQEELNFATINAWQRTFILDDAGNRYEHRSSSGISADYMINHWQKGLPMTLPAGARATASFSFSSPRGMEKKGRIFSFSSEQALVTLLADRNIRVQGQLNISIRNIEPR